jgi:pimeloyl-ACP methyl ester carboxylesterase
LVAIAGAAYRAIAIDLLVVIAGAAYRAIAIDLPGFGDAAVEAETAPYTAVLDTPRCPGCRPLDPAVHETPDIPALVAHDEFECRTSRSARSNCRGSCEPGPS